MTRATAERLGEDWDDEAARFVSGQVIYVAGGPKA
jgi:hypothetical protein